MKTLGHLLFVAGVFNHAAEGRLLKRNVVVKSALKDCDGRDGGEQYPPCGPLQAPVPEPEPLEGRIIPEAQHQPFPIAAHNEINPPAIRTQYDRCVFDELANRPASAQHGFARNCYTDCLKGRATFAPRMCYRLCVNALTLKYGDGNFDANNACANICPNAAFQLRIKSDFCPPLPEESIGPFARRAMQQEEDLAAHESTYGPIPVPAPAPQSPMPPGAEYPAHRKGVWDSREWPSDVITARRRWPYEANDTVTTDGRLMDNAT